MDDIEGALLREFLLESFENLSNISEELMHFEKNPEDTDILGGIYRKVHTLKGSASFMGLKKLQDLTHITENVLDNLRDKKMRLNDSIMDLLLSSFDACIVMIKSIEETGKEGHSDHSGIIKKLEKIAKGETLSDDEISSIPAKNSSKEGTQIVKKVVKKVIKKQAPQEVLKTEKTIVKQEEITSQVQPNQKASDSVHSITDSVVRVNVQLLDKIMNVVGELVLNRNQILQFSNTADNHQLSRLTHQLNVITTELQADIMKTRMQPVGTVIGKFDRVIRDLARSQGKNIGLVITGQDTELDKTLLETIRDPLTHMIRNSVDHGIELPEVREKLGKNKEAKILIKAYHEGGQVTIEINDDGKGIDPSVIGKKAVEKGLLTQEKLDSYSEKQILSLIFLPGFSTAEQVTNISGRGVGMDVVKSNIDKIGGSVEIESVVGKGSTFKLKIPLTLAIIPALIVESKGESFAIPQINLLELVRLEEGSNESKLEKIQNKEFFRLRGDLIPIFNMSDVFQLDQIREKKQMMTKALSTRSDSSEQHQVKSTFTSEDGLNIAILKAEGHIFGIIVDTILDTEEIVVKPLSKKLKGLKTFAGVTIMGDGGVSLIIDALGFYNFISGTDSRAVSEESMSDEKSIQENLGDMEEYLLCRLSDNRQYAIALGMVGRLEEFTKDRVEWSGKRALIQYGDKAMPLINLEKIGEFNGQSPLDRDEGVIPCVVVKLRSEYYGLVVSQIDDIAVSSEPINENTSDRMAILGTVNINNKIVSILDIHSIIDELFGGKKDGSIAAGSSVKEQLEKLEGISGKKILLAEDSPLYRKIEFEFLSELGAEVAVAKNGLEAFEYLKRNKDIDLLITDIEMPAMNGYELCSHLRSMDGYAKLPVIAVSTRVREEDLKKGRDAGFSMHLEKLNKIEVLKAVKKYL